MTIQDYRNDLCDWDRFVEAIWPSVVRQVRLTTKFRRDETLETAAEFYPEFVRLSDRYRDLGSSFEAYLRASIRHYCRRCSSDYTDQRRREVVIEPDSPLFGDSVASEDPDMTPPQILPIARPGAPLRVRDAQRRQIIFVICLNLPALSSSEIERYSALLDLPLEWLRTMQTAANSVVSRRRDRRLHFSEKRDRHFSSMCELSRKLASCESESTRRKLTCRYRFHRKRWIFYRERCLRQRCTLSHSEIGTILGVPKGSIDSAIATFRHTVEQQLGRE